MNKFKNSKKQGDWGVGEAIAYFTRTGATVCIPLTDSQEYDLVVEIEGKLQRVQVKSSTYKTPHKIYSVSLTTKGGNQSYNTVKGMDKSKVDLLFISTPEGNYLMPVKGLGNSVNLGTKYEQYKLDNS